VLEPVIFPELQYYLQSVNKL